MDDKDKTPGVKINLNLDTTPILYTDNIFIGVSTDGVVLDFGQKLGPTNELRIVSRIGMSREQAKKFFKTLGEQLKLSETNTPVSKSN